MKVASCSLGLLLVSVLSCSDSNAPFHGTIEVVVQTTGPDPDSNGYALLIDGETAAIAPSDTLVARDVSPGSHVVTLSDVAPNCRLMGNNPRTLQLSAGDSVRTTFAIGCAATTGEVRLILRQSGISIDANGFLVTIGGRSIRVGVSLDTVLRLPAGNYVASVEDVAPHCVTYPELPQPLPLGVGQFWTFDWEVRCDLKAEDRIVFNFQTHLYSVRLDGTGLTRLNPPNQTCDCATNAAVTRSGSRIAWHSYGIWAMNRDSTAYYQRAASNAGDSRPAWSPDETQLVFVDTHSEGRDLYVINADGSGRARLTTIRL